MRLLVWPKEITKQTNGKRENEQKHPQPIRVKVTILRVHPVFCVHDRESRPITSSINHLLCAKDAQKIN